MFGHDFWSFFTTFKKRGSYLDLQYFQYFNNEKSSTSIIANSRLCLALEQIFEKIKKTKRILKHPVSAYLSESDNI